MFFAVNGQSLMQLRFALERLYSLPKLKGRRMKGRMAGVYISSILSKQPLCGVMI